MEKIKGECKNVDEGCPYCFDRTVQEKEKSEPFVCEGCGKPLIQIDSSVKGSLYYKYKKIFIFLIIVLAAVGIAVYFMLKPSPPPLAPIPQFDIIVK